MAGESAAKAWTSALSRPGITKIHHDILSQIFFLLSRADDNYLYHSRFNRGKWDWACVSEVSQFWRAVALGTPRLWAYIDNYNFGWTKRLQMSMRLSKKAELIIHYIEITGSKDIPFGNLKIAMKEMGRIAHLYLHATFTEAQAIEFFPYMDLPAPRMQTMSIGISRLTLPHFNLPSTTPGVLKEVVLYDIKAPESISRYTCFSGLSRLELRSCFLSLSKLMRILMACPTLEVLHVGYCDVDISDFSFAKLKTIHLPYLEKMDLEDIKGFTVASDILQSVDAPNVSQWAVQCDDMLDVDDVSKFEIFYRLLKREFLADGISIQLNCLADLAREESSSFKIAGDERRLRIQFNQVDRNAILERWIEMFREHLTRISLLDLQMCDDSTSTETWSVLLSACASAKIVKVRMGQDFSNYGPPARTLRVGELVRSLPCLQHLVVYWNDDDSWENVDDPVLFIGDLEEFLEKRSTMGFPAVKVTVHSYEAESDCIIHNGLEGIAALRLWEEGVKRMRKLSLEAAEREALNNR